MTTTSISYGHFSYHNRIEFEGILKQPIYGNGTPKLEAGQCRIVLKNNEDIENYNIHLLKTTTKHYYHYWIENF